ncbi:hypothetical protein AB0O08_16545 [Streptomyces anulatus]|uniref:hypothetical protein n=1 Tax=Streptomyces anulatus TaxID=1892 RepID=UPI003435C1FA
MPSPACSASGRFEARPDSVVMLPETAVEFTYGWTVRYDLKEHIETGDFTKARSPP